MMPMEQPTGTGALLCKDARRTDALEEVADQSEVPKHRAVSHSIGIFLVQVVHCEQ